MLASTEKFSLSIKFCIDPKYVLSSHLFLIFAVKSMRSKQILDQHLLKITINRLCQQLLENHGNFEKTVLLGLQPRGIFLAERIKNRLSELLGKDIPLGHLDPTFYRDDFRRREEPIKANTTNIPFLIEGANVILIDDVLYTGRTVRAALDAMIAFGRPNKVELLVLINRKYSRDLPIEPDYIGKSVYIVHEQRVKADWTEQGYKKDSIWLVNI